MTRTISEKTALSCCCKQTKGRHIAHSFRCPARPLDYVRSTPANKRKRKDLRARNMSCNSCCQHAHSHTQIRDSDAVKDESRRADSGRMKDSNLFEAKGWFRKRASVPERNRHCIRYCECALLLGAMMMVLMMAKAFSHRVTRMQPVESRLVPPFSSKSQKLAG